MKVHGLLVPRIKIEDPDNDLLTLYPDSRPTEISVPIGFHASPRYQERKDEGADTLPYLAIATTPLVELRIRESYEIGLKNILGEFPGYVWWWDFGKKGEIVRKRLIEGKGGGEFDVPVADGFGESRQISVEMVERPIFAVEE